MFSKGKELSELLAGKIDHTEYQESFVQSPGNKQLSDPLLFLQLFAATVNDFTHGGPQVSRGGKQITCRGRYRV